MYCKPKYRAILFKIISENNLVLYSVLFNFGHIRRWDQSAVYILYSKTSTDTGLLKIRHSHRFVAVFLIPNLSLGIGREVGTAFGDESWTEKARQVLQTILFASILAWLAAFDSRASILD